MYFTSKVFLWANMMITMACLSPMDSASKML